MTETYNFLLERFPPFERARCLL